MDTRMLDVAIGLTLVFALFSLLVATVQETYASMLNNRGDTMNKLVCSLVGDNHQLAQRLMATPFLQTMMMERRNGKPRPPSYLESDVFVTGLLAFLTSHTAGLRPSSPAILVQELKNKPQLLDPRDVLADNLAALLPGVEHDWPAFEMRLQGWFNAAAERSTGWYKRKVQWHLFLFGLLFAVLLNVNPIVIGQALWRDAALRAFAVQQADIALRVHAAQTGTATVADNAKSSQHLAPAVAGMANDTARTVDRALDTLSQILEKAHQGSGADRPGANTEEMRRLRPAAEEIVSMQRVMLEIRAALTLERAAASADPEIKRRQAAAPIAVDIALDTLRNRVPAGTYAEPGCTLKNPLLCPYAKRIDASIRALEAHIPKERDYRSPASSDTATAAMLRRHCKGGADMPPATQALCEQLQGLGIFEQSGIPIGWTEAGWPPVFSRCGHEPGSDDGHACSETGSRLPPLVDYAMRWAIVPTGWLLTAVSAMLGAAFWFDLLNKLVKLRNSGIKPEQSATAAVAGAASAAPPPSTLSQATQPGSETGNAPSLDAFNDTERQLTDEDVVRIQRNLGMVSAQQSGRIDLATRDAILAWQRANGVNATGELTFIQAQQILRNSTLVDDDGYVG